MYSICVVAKGWVFVGKLQRDGDMYILEDGSVVRNWGTTHGLGQLANFGPLPATTLDPLPLTRFHESKLIFTIHCNQEKWENYMGKI